MDDFGKQLVAAVIWLAVLAFLAEWVSARHVEEGER